MSQDDVLIEVRDAVAFLTINRPEKMNAITPGMASSMAHICAEIDEDSAIKVVLLRGAGTSAFSAGSDIKALGSYGSAWDFRNRVEYAAAVRNIRKPVIAAVKGWVLGGGLEMALAADIRVADRTAKFGAPEVKHGWVGGGGASQLLPRLVGYGQAMKLLLTGKNIDVEEAARIGLVDMIADERGAEETSVSLCKDIAVHDAVALQAVKAAVRGSLSTSLEQGLKYENDLTTLCFAIGNYRGGVDAFSGRTRSAE